MLEEEYKMKHRGGGGHFNLGSQGGFCRWGSTHSSLRDEIGIQLLDQEPEGTAFTRELKLEACNILGEPSVQGGERWDVDKARGLGRAESWRASFVLSRNLDIKL